MPRTNGAQKSKQEKTTASAPPSVMAGQLSPFEGLRRNIDRMFDEVAHGWPWHWDRPMFDLVADRGRGAIGWALAPDVDIAEDDKELTITAELPGLDDKDIEVELSDDVLTLSGEKKTETEEKKKDYYLSERRYGSFRRSFRLPEGVDAAKIKADFKNGVLTIACPKTAAAKKRAKKISIHKR